MPSNIHGIVAEFLRDNFDGLFQVLTSSIAVAGASVTIVPNNPERVFVFMANVGSEVVTVNLQNNAAIGSGFLIAPLGGIVSFNLRDDFVMPSLEINAIAAGAGSTLFRVQVIRTAKLSERETDNAI